MQKDIADRFAEKYDRAGFSGQLIDGCGVAFSARFLAGKIKVIWVKLSVGPFEEIGEILIGEPLDDAGLKNALK
ncbi:hypothetical protein [Phaeobacter sp. C3_T13_0]|uniref:hypothetical protein n=1 Tax=Phaeobacter cretensis TaxID=3342641 RepID=UPI0039BCB661